MFGLRRLDRIRLLVPCFRPLGLLGSSGGKAFSQDHPKGYINWNFLRLFRFFEIWGCPEASLWGNFLSFFLIFVEVKQIIDFGALWAGAGGRGRGSSKLQILRF